MHLRGFGITATNYIIM